MPSYLIISPSIVYLFSTLPIYLQMVLIVYEDRQDMSNESVKSL
jgi:hypothetical protein